MFRIFTTNEPGAITLTVDGQLTGDYVDVVMKSVEQAIAACASICLFLRDVSFIDERGRKLLVNLAAKGVRLTARGVYSSFVVGQVAPDPARQGSGAAKKLPPARTDIERRICGSSGS